MRAIRLFCILTLTTSMLYAQGFGDLDDHLGDGGLSDAAGNNNRIELVPTAERDIVKTYDDGFEEVVRVHAKKILPGEEIIYTIAYTNLGSDPAEDVVITCPIPARMHYRNLSAEKEGLELLFSVDNGATFDHPESLIVVDKNGKRVLARTKDFTHIKWKIKDTLPPGSFGKVSFKASLTKPPIDVP
jgi:uncharacterized repeat protein (TIGR01451 family)